MKKFKFGPAGIILGVTTLLLLITPLISGLFNASEASKLLAENQKASVDVLKENVESIDKLSKSLSIQAATLAILDVLKDAYKKFFEAQAKGLEQQTTGLGKFLRSMQPMGKIRELDIEIKNKNKKLKEAQDFIDNIKDIFKKGLESGEFSITGLFKDPKTAGKVSFDVNKQLATQLADLAKLQHDFTAKNLSESIAAFEGITNDSKASFDDRNVAIALWYSNSKKLIELNKDDEKKAVDANINEREREVKEQLKNNALTIEQRKKLNEILLNLEKERGIRTNQINKEAANNLIKLDQDFTTQKTSFLKTIIDISNKNFQLLNDNNKNARDIQILVEQNYFDKDLKIQKRSFINKEVSLEDYNQLVLQITTKHNIRTIDNQTAFYEKELKSLKDHLNTLKITNKNGINDKEIADISFKISIDTEEINKFNTALDNLDLDPLTEIIKAKEKLAESRSFNSLIDSLVQITIQAEKAASAIFQTSVAAGDSSEIAAGKAQKLVDAYIGLNKEGANLAETTEGLLTPAFTTFFSTIESGGDGLKAFFTSLVDSIKQLIAKLAAAAAVAGILTAITDGGGAGFLTFFKSLLGFRAAGGPVTAGGSYIVGEKGPLQEKWLRSLEKHPERQMQNWLGIRQKSGVYKACCLGEAGLIAGVCKWIGNNLIVKKKYTGEIYDSIPSRQELAGTAYEALGLRSSIGDPAEGSKLLSLVDMNDKDSTWPQIAAHLRKHPKVYFTKSV